MTTQENSLLVWGSRPCIKSPLHALLAQSDHAPSLKARMGAHKRRESDVSLSPMKAVTFDIPSASDPPSPLELPPPTSLTTGGSRDKVHRSSSLNLSHLPHQMTVCPQASQYTKMLSQLLAEVKARGDSKRGPSVSSEGGVSLAGSLGAEREGVILEPTSVDLVGRCGLLADLSAQGLQQAKLECVSSFAGNLLILIEAKVPEEEEKEKERAASDHKSLKVSPPKPLLMMSKRLIERRHWNRSGQR